MSHDLRDTVGLRPSCFLCCWY